MNIPEQDNNRIPNLIKYLKTAEYTLIVLSTILQNKINTRMILTDQIRVEGDTIDFHFLKRNSYSTTMARCSLLPLPPDQKLFFLYEIVLITVSHY